jgi:hypothetical protein
MSRAGFRTRVGRSAAERPRWLRECPLPPAGHQLRAAAARCALSPGNAARASSFAHLTGRSETTAQRHVTPPQSGAGVASGARDFRDERAELASNQRVLNFTPGKERRKAISGRVLWGNGLRGRPTRHPGQARACPGRVIVSRRGGSSAGPAPGAGSPRPPRSSHAATRLSPRAGSVSPRTRATSLPPRRPVSDS